MQLHGSIPYTELRMLGLSPDAIIDFSATVNPFPVPDIVKETICRIPLSAYPDPEAHDAVEAVAAFYDLPENWCLITTGMTEPIFILPAFFSSAAYFSPSYGDYAAAFRRYGGSLQGIPFTVSDGGWAQTSDSLRNLNPELVIICNPNNPDGTYTSLDQIEEICRTFSDTTVYVDESYQEMAVGCESAVSLVNRYANLLVAKSLTKPFGIGGVRVAYLMGSGPMLENIRSRLLPWGVSMIAQTIVPVLFSIRETFREQWNTIITEKEKLVRGITALGYPVNSSRAPYFLVTTGNAADTRKQLLEGYRIHVRDCTSFGMRDTIRIMPQLPEQNDQILESLRKMQ